MRSRSEVGEQQVSLVSDGHRSAAVEHHRLEEMAGGWFVGDFSPAALRCTGAEVALKHISAGGHEPRHEHRLATEVTVVVAGTVSIADREWTAGDVIVIPPHTPAAFTALTDATLVVVKSPSLVGDKYPVKERPRDRDVSVVDSAGRSGVLEIP